MSIDINSLNGAIENWKFVFIEDENSMQSLIEGAHTTDPEIGSRMEALVARARSNATKYLERHNFQLLGNGFLVRGHLSGRPTHVLEINIVDPTVIGFLGRLEMELGLRAERVPDQKFQPWFVGGYLRGNPTYRETIALDAIGLFYLEGRRVGNNMIRIPAPVLNSE